MEIPSIENKQRLRFMLTFLLRHFSLPGRASEYPEERRRGRDSPRWHSHKKHTSKRDHHYKKHCKLTNALLTAFNLVIWI